MTRREVRCTGRLIAILMLTSIATVASAAEKPNVVFIVMDNLGWGEIGAYGGGILRGAETPRLDTLAAEPPIKEGAPDPYKPKK